MHTATRKDARGRGRVAAHARSSKGVLLQREWSRMLGPQTGRGHPGEGPSEEEEAARPAAGSEDRADVHVYGALGTTRGGVARQRSAGIPAAAGAPRGPG